MPENLTPEDAFIDQATTPVLRACDFLVAKRDEGKLNPNSKLDGGFYDDAEITGGATKILADELGIRFPNHTIIIDRAVMQKGDPEKELHVDPVDGTINFIRYFADWGVSLYYLEKGVPVAALFRSPDTDSTFVAIKGKGAYLNGKSIHVNAEDNLRTAVVGFDFGIPKNKLSTTNRVIRRLEGRTRQLVTRACASAQMANIAEGGSVAFIHTAYPQDLAPGFLLVTEAGGKVTHQDGSEIVPGDWTKEMIDWVATNGTSIHEQLVEIIKKKGLENYQKHAKNWRHSKKV